MTDQDHLLVRSYMKRLGEALRDQPRGRRDEMISEIEAHINEELRQLDHSPTDVEVRDMLDRLGEPEAIAADASDGEAPRSDGLGGLEITALILLLIGGFFPFALGWLIGVVVLWISSSWKVGQKVLGTLVVPGGLAMPLFLINFVMGSGEVCSGGKVFKRMPNGREKLIENEPLVCTSSGPAPWVRPVVMVVLVLASIATVIYLGRAARRRPFAS